MRLHAYAPTRIDLAGGTLDIWPLYLFHPGALTVNLAIRRYAHCVLEPRRSRRIMLVGLDSGQREEFRSLRELESSPRRRQLPLLSELVAQFQPPHGLRLTTWSEVPQGAGLGGSSALAVAICAALARWRGRREAPQTWIALARDIEARVLGVPTGEQDHYPAVYGGVSAIHLDPKQTWREPLPAPARALEERLLLVYTGKPRRSGINNWEVLKSYLDGDLRLRRNFGEIAECAAGMRQALWQKDWAAVGRWLTRDGEVRRRNAPGITTPFIDDLMRRARRVGATGAKVCGAGGGGCVVFFVPPRQRARLAEALARAGATLLPFRVARRGVQVERWR